METLFVPYPQSRNRIAEQARDFGRDEDCSEVLEIPYIVKMEIQRIPRNLFRPLENSTKIRGYA